MKTMDQVITEVEAIMAAHDEGAELDAGFDAGEFSGPEHARMADDEIKELAEANGFTYDQVYDEIMRRAMGEDAGEQAASRCERISDEEADGKGPCK